VIASILPVAEIGQIVVLAGMERILQHLEHRLDPEIPFETIVADVLKFIDTDITYMRRVVRMTEQAEKSQVDIVNAFTVVVPEFYYITVYIA
jgi:hypothetical protein